MSMLKVYCFGISMDGFGAGPNQSLENPLGEGGTAIHDWFFPTNTFQKMHSGKPFDESIVGTTGIDDDFAAKSFENIGAWIMGRNMFTPTRGNWANFDWKGWWGDNPPYHSPVYILTNFPRPSIEMEGETVFHFVTEGIDVALDLAKKSAQNKDVRLLGGVNTIRQYLQKKLVDEMHIVVAPTILGTGESLFGGLNLIELGYNLKEKTLSQKAMHCIIQKV